MRFVCEIDGSEYVLEAEGPEAAARRAAAAHAAAAAVPRPTRCVVNVAEANEADFPLIAGTDYSVTLDAGDER